LEFSPEQEELRSSIRAILEKECPPSVARSGEWEPLWKQMVALDWPGLTVPEEAGGLGMSFVDLAVLVEELGRVIAPGPLFATASQVVPALRSVGATELLGQVARGEFTGGLAVAGVVMLPAEHVLVIRDGELHMAVEPVITP